VFCQGHLEQAKQICSYLYQMRHATIRFCTHEPDYSDLPNVKQKWDASVYGDVEEELPYKAPPPLGKQVILVIFNCCNYSRPVLLPIVLFSEECPANQIRSINKRELIEPSLKLPILIHHFITFIGTQFYDGRGLIVLPTWWINSLVW
jgi:hypothetical protein